MPSVTSRPRSHRVIGIGCFLPSLPVLWELACSEDLRSPGTSRSLGLQRVDWSGRFLFPFALKGLPHPTLPHSQTLGPVFPGKIMTGLCELLSTPGGDCGCGLAHCPLGSTTLILLKGSLPLVVVPLWPSSVAGFYPSHRYHKTPQEKNVIITSMVGWKQPFSRCYAFVAQELLIH